MAQLEVWAQEEPENKYNLPSFSAYPQSYATAGGEYLMMLPQVLEVLMVHDDDNQPEAALDGDWLDKVTGPQQQGYKLLSLAPSQPMLSEIQTFDRAIRDAQAQPICPHNIV